MHGIIHRQKLCSAEKMCVILDYMDMLKSFYQNISIRIKNNLKFHYELNFYNYVLKSEQYFR